MADRGRPPKYETPEQMQEAINGEVAYTGEKLETSDFGSEKEMVEYLFDNAGRFINSMFDDSILSAEIDFPLNKQITLSGRGRRVDLIIRGSRKTYAIEAKNPKYKRENRLAIGQILDYGRELEDKNIEMVIVTSKFDEDTAKTIKYYNLPIRYIYLSKRYTLEFIEIL